MFLEKCLGKNCEDKNLAIQVIQQQDKMRIDYPNLE